MKKIKIDKKFIISIVVLIFILIGIIIINNKPITIKKIGNKYDGHIDISLVKGEDTKNNTYEFMYDGRNLKILSDLKAEPIYYLNNRLIYTQDDKIYEFEVNDNYTKMYDILKEPIKIKKIRAASYYQGKYSSEQINELFKNLYLNIKVKGEVNSNIFIDKGIINKVSLELNKIDKFDTILINIEFNKNDTLILNDLIIKAYNNEKGIIISEDGRGMTPKINPYQESVMERIQAEKNILEIE